MRKVVLLLAALLVLIPVAGADIADEIRTLDGSGNNRNHPNGARRTRRTCGSPGRTTPTGSRSLSRARRPVRQQPRSSTTPTRTCSPRTASRSGASSGVSSSTTRSASGEEAGGENAPIPFNAHRSAGDLHQHPRRDPVHPHAGRARHGDRQRRRASRSTRSRSYIDAFSVYGGTAAPAGLAARGAGRRQPRQQRRHAAAAGRLPAARATPRQRGDRARRWR